MTVSEAISYVSLYCQSTVDPVLSDDEITALVNAVRIVDSEGRLITDEEWVPTYDLARAVRDGWELKAAKASSAYAMSDPNTSLHREQVFAHCQEMVKRWEKRIAQSIDITSDFIEEAIEDDEFSD